MAILLPFGPSGLMPIDWFFLKVIIGKFYILDNLLMIFNDPTGIDNWEVIFVILLVFPLPHFLGDDGKFDLPLLLHIDFQDACDPSHEIPGDLEVIPIVVPHELDLGLELTHPVVPFQVLLMVLVLDIVLECNPCTVVVAVDEVVDYLGLGFVKAVLGGRVGWEVLGFGFEFF